MSNEPGDLPLHDDPLEPRVTPLSAPPEQGRQLDYDQMELSLGIRWLSRIGIVAILVGFTMALCYSFPHFSSEMKLLTGAILALGFFGGGSKLHHGAPILGRILQGGGLALGYLSLFGLFFIPSVRLIDSSLLGYVLLFGYTVGVMGLSHKLKSQTTAVLALAFGYYTAGYAASYEVAFISTAILMLGNAGLIRQYPDWQVATKANLLGGLWTYCHWGQMANLQHETVAQLYLGYMYGLFHIIAVRRAGKGDVALNVLNTFACYILFKWTSSSLAFSAWPEFIIGAMQLGSLAWVYHARPEERNAQLPYSLLLMGLVFSGLGVARYFSPNLTTAVTAALALFLGLLGKKGVYTRVMNIAAYYLIVWAGWNLIAHWSLLTDAEELWNGLALVISSFVLEATAFRTHHPAWRSVLLLYSSLLFFCEIMDALPAHYRTISFVLAGFVWLASGLITRRRLYRILGLSWIFVIGGFSLIGDFIFLETIYKILLFILLGVGLLGGSYGYVLLERRLSMDAQRFSIDHSAYAPIADGGCMARNDSRSLE